MKHAIFALDFALLICAAIALAFGVAWFQVCMYMHWDGPDSFCALGLTALAAVILIFAPLPKLD